MPRATPESERDQAQRLDSVESSLVEIRQEMLKEGFGNHGGSVDLPLGVLGSWEDRLRQAKDKVRRLSREEKDEAEYLEGGYDKCPSCSRTAAQRDALGIMLAEKGTPGDAIQYALDHPYEWRPVYREGLETAREMKAAGRTPDEIEDVLRGARYGLSRELVRSILETIG